MPGAVEPVNRAPLDAKMATPGLPCTAASGRRAPRPFPRLFPGRSPRGLPPLLGAWAVGGAIALGVVGFAALPLAAQTPPATGAEAPPLAQPAGGPDTALVPGEATAAALADLAALDACLAAPAAPATPADAAQLQRLRSLYLLAVDDEPGLRRAWETHRALAASRWGRTPDGAALLEGYRGALQALEGKHGFWPHARFRDLRQGLAILDAQVEATPSQEEVRYLRLLSTAFLPGILGRRGSAEADLQALAILLPPAAERYPLRTWTSMADAVEALLRDTAPDLARETASAFSQARERARVAGIPLAPGCHVE